MKNNLLMFLILIALSGCLFNSPTRVADKYFNAIYTSSNFELEEGTNFFDNFNNGLIKMKELTAPYVTSEQSESILGGLKLVVTSVIFSIIQNDYDFSVKETKYSLNKLESDDNNKSYDYIVRLKLTDADGNVTIEEFKGIITLTNVDDKWRVNEDKLLIYDFN